VSDNQKECEKIQLDLKQTLENGENHETSQVLGFYKKRLGSIEDYISELQRMTFSIDKVRP
jgi:hypothetical protein